MKQLLETKRIISALLVAVMATAIAICPMLWATAPKIPATQSCFFVSSFRSKIVVTIASAPPAAE